MKLPTKKVTIQTLRALGFDRSRWGGTGQYFVACSQCQALVINGTPCHEGGCPNRPRNIDVED